MKGFLAYNCHPRTWRFGFERTYEATGRPWLWLMLGPVAINVGSF